MRHWPATFDERQEIGVADSANPNAPAHPAASSRIKTMRNHMSRSTIVALAFAIGATGLTFGGAVNAADACAGQSYPNWSEACKQQKLDKLANSMVVKEKPKSRAPAANFKTN